MKEGQCSGRKGPGKGRSPAAARAPLSGPEREGRRLLAAASSSFGPRHLRGLYGPASWPVPAPWAGNGGPGPPCESLVPALDESVE